ncbi:TPA: restriction endonuclease subunit S [Vibrio cholerae]
MISPEFKRFPNEWKVLPFLEVFEDVTSKGKKVKKENYQITGDIPVVDQGQKFFGGYTDEANKITGVDLPAIVFGDHTKAFKYVEVDFAIGADGVKLLNPKIDADKKFLFYYLKQLKLEDAGYSRHFKFLKETYIPLPPLETQKKIAAVLEKADQLRKDCQQMEQELNSLAQSVFIDMFGDPVTNPKGWDLKFLSSLGEVKGGLQVTSKRSVNPISVPYLRVANVYRDHLELEEVKEIQVTDKELKSVLLEKGDVLFVEGHGNANEVGRAAVWNNEIPQCVHQNHLIRFRPGPAIRPEFLSAFVNSASGRRQLLQMSKTTSGLNTLSTSNIKSIQVLVPPLQKQDEYLAFLASSKAQQWVNGQLSIELDENFNALMQKAFKGDLTL